MAAPSDNGSGAAAHGGGLRVHATCVAIGERGVLLRGPPGAGKSDLALRLIAGPPPTGEPEAFLVADDQVVLTREGDTLVARAPENIAGLMEIRGVGIRRVPCVAAATVALIVDLVAREALVRLPPDPLPTEDMLGIALPSARLAPFESSAPLKLRMLMGAWRAAGA
jgi:serine kinase of HPr protein (carbohydrate metabolism regulator)